MSDELKNILSNLNKDIEQDKLLEYINRNLPDAEQHDLEKQMNDDEFMNDAIEGLEQLQHKQEIPLYIKQLNAGLAKQLSKNKKRNDKRKLPSQFWTYISILLVLLLIVTAYFILKSMNG